MFILLKKTDDETAEVRRKRGRLNEEMTE